MGLTSSSSSSNGSNGGPTITNKNKIWINSATEFLRKNTINDILDVDAVKTEIEKYNNYEEFNARCKSTHPFNLAIQPQIDKIVNSGKSSDDKITELNLLKDKDKLMYDAHKIFLNYDNTNQTSECSIRIFYMKTLIDGIKKVDNTYSLQRPPPSKSDENKYNELVKKIDDEITKINSSKTSFLGSLFGRGGRKQKRTKKGRKISKRKTKKHKKTRTRKR
jgi:trehalose-6-phosphate synthase